MITHTFEVNRRQALHHPMHPRSHLPVAPHGGCSRRRARTCCRPIVRVDVYHAQHAVRSILGPGLAAKRRRILLRLFQQFRSSESRQASSILSTFGGLGWRHLVPVKFPVEIVHKTIIRDQFHWLCCGSMEHAKPGHGLVVAPGLQKSTEAWMQVDLS